MYATALFVAALVPLVAGPDELSTDAPSASITMAFAVMGLGTVFNALVNRRDPASGLGEPILKALGISLVPLAMIFLATELPGLQRGAATRNPSPVCSGSPASASRRSCPWSSRAASGSAGAAG